MRASRLLTIQMMLQARGRMSAPALAEALEVSVRTIYRDVDALSAAGVAIYAEPGRDGGIALLDGFRTKLTGLTPPESLALPFAGLAGVARDLGVGDAAVAANFKLLASLPAEAGARAQWIAARFHLDPLAWFHRAEPSDTLPALAAAVWRDRRIALRYQAWRSVVSRCVDPLGLVQKGGVWYLVAKTQNQVRTYRVSSILSFEVLDSAAQRPKRFDLARFWAQWSKAFEEKILQHRARILISREGRALLRASFPAADEIVGHTCTPAKKRGWVEADFPMESPSYCARQLLRLGSEVAVVGPKALRAAIAKEARKVMLLNTAPLKTRHP